ncbi:MAG: putative toxin-antitoxin system toxin component, PIN family [Phycisphaeraceae bacterium]|nr:putative toxin-antitoxin system toxin component, PIN family [Phycisphaeraceae bacterium]
MRVVLDTNVLLAALGTRGLCEALMDVCIESHELVLSQHILDELHEHLSGKFKMPKRRAAEVVSFLREHAELVEPASVAKGTVKDRDDLPVLGTAVAAKADVLVTGDHELQALGVFHGIPILSPRAFYDQLR